MTKRMGFEGKAYYGTAGSTGATELTNSRDISFKLATEKGDTTVRGSSGVPKKTSRVTQLSADDIEIVMLNDNSDTALEAMRVASAAGTAVAIRLKDYAAGKGFDGDCILEFSHPYPLNGEQVVTITCMPTDEAGRTWEPYV